MMKKLVFSLLALTAFCAAAVPAFPWPQHIVQPDGTSLTVVMHGDEWNGYATTADGYTIATNEKGAFCYAQVQNGQLVASSMLAHDAQQRVTAEQQYLLSVPKHLQADAATATARRAAMRQAAVEKGLMRKATMDVSRFRGLVILVEFNDRKFLFNDAREKYEHMFNDEGYAGFYNDSLKQWQNYTGSLLDYYNDNTSGHFRPHFDVVGPVSVDYSQQSPGGSDNTRSRSIFSAALKAADAQVDFSEYDADDDGVVDMVFFIVPGGGSNAGNNSNYLWPHKWSLTGYASKLDGKSFDVYACSTELYGYQRDNRWDGIGTIAHEFTHVLGLGDLYDADYTTGGLSSHPGKWSIMASGSYLNMACTPSGYGLYERMSMGWANITPIDAQKSYTLQPLQNSGSGYRINLPAVNGEFFLLENRQPIKWDSYLPGHGMLVWRVDSTDVTPYERNRINANASHNYYELVRAQRRDTTIYYNNKPYEVAVDCDSDPFPGSAQVTELSNGDATPRLNSWTGASSPWILKNIKESSTGVVTFRTEADPVKSYVETFEQMPLTQNDTTQVPGAFSQWNLSKKARVVEPDSGWCNGHRALALLKNSEAVTTTPITQAVNTITCTFGNPTTSSAVFRVYYSTNGGASWTFASRYTGESISRLAAGESATYTYRIETDSTKATTFRIMLFSGSSTVPCYVDDVIVSYVDNSTPVLVGDVNGDGVIDVADVNYVINAALNDNTNLRADVNGDGEVDVSDVNTVINIVLYGQ
ncbi:MAG: M6 family metalloprotease domain-containing protein [Muribaculaceae bacterium]|nr:M6 family metalloprotease domain-containing protein [Muribaculaceae bacterium]